jgi:hypothetical protein
LIAPDSVYMSRLLRVPGEPSAGSGLTGQQIISQISRRDNAGIRESPGR